MTNRPTVFVATSKRFYREAEQVVRRLRDIELTVFHPYFHLDPRDIDADPSKKSAVTLQHFKEIDRSDLLFALLPGGYIGHSVTIEITYAYARMKRLVASHAPDEYAVRSMVDTICGAGEFVAQLQSEWGSNNDQSNRKP